MPSGTTARSRGPWAIAQDVICTPGNYDAVFAYVDQSPPGVRLVSMQGENTAPPVVSTSVVGDSANLIDHFTTPAIEVGRSGSTTKLLLAYVIDWYGTPYVRFGTVAELSGGNWSFIGTSWLALSSYEACTGVSPTFFNVALAYDVTRSEWGFGVKCGEANWAAHFFRIRWNGTVVSGSHMQVHQGTGDAHSPVGMAYNRQTRRFMFNFEHNTALINASTIPYTCVPDTPGCISALYPFGVYGGTWAVEPDYFSGFEFRVARAAATGGGFGESYELITGQVGDQGTHWAKETGNLWPSRPSGWTSMAHDYVRAPEFSRTVVLHMYEGQTSALGQLRFTFIDEVSTVPFDE